MHSTLLLLACTGSSADVAPMPSDTSSSVDDTAPLDTTGLNGDRIDPQLPAPSFASVLNSDGSPRSQPDLMGHPTVVWFYPAAGTLG